MIYLSQMLKRPVKDVNNNKIGVISDLAISTGEVFPRITSLAFKGPDKTPIMISWRKFVECIDEEGVKLKVEQKDIRFSYLQPQEVLIARDLMNRQIVDTQGLKVVRVNDLKLSEYGNQLRLLGAEVGIRGLLRGLSPFLEKLVCKFCKLIKKPLHEQLIAWNYMDLLDRDLSKVKLSVSHKRLEELHPADVADILEQLDPAKRAQVFQMLDFQQGADTVAELQDDLQAEFLDYMDDKKASKLLGEMDPDDAVDIVRDLPYEKAEKVLRLMGLKDANKIRQLLGYKDGTAGGMMTTQYVAVNENKTVNQTIDVLRELDDDHPPVHYVYALNEKKQLVGVVSLKSLALNRGNKIIKNIMHSDDIITVNPEVEEEEVSNDIFKYDLTAMPVVDEKNVLLGIVTTEDAWDAIEEEGSFVSKNKTAVKIVTITLGFVLFLVFYTIVVVSITELIKQ